ncbi:MAG: MFS transporter [Casimicrobiaceae bacterium]|nr:MFS transporter [Casimicrobiaceae bacterium]
MNTVLGSFSPAERRTIVLLAACQGLLFTNTVILMAVNALVGHMLAENKALATLPAMTYVVGSAVSAIPVSRWMERVGRRAGFMHGSLLAIAGALVCAASVLAKSFWGVCAGTFLIGCYNATGALYRFAAADAISGPNKARAISLVLAGGILGGLIGPESSKFSKDWLAVTYAGTYLSLVAFALLALALQWQLKLPPLVTPGKTASGGRPLATIIRQPRFIVAVMAAALGYGVMNLLMVATPLAMQFCGHPFSAGVFVLEWHVVGMFAPGFFTGNLIKRFGVSRVLWAGVALNLACVAINLAGTTVAHFWVGLFLLGVGWNFLFVGGTTLLTETYTSAEKTRVQGFNDMLIFATMAVSSSSAGLLVNARGWEMVNYTALPAIALVALALLWLGPQSHRTA